MEVGIEGQAGKFAFEVEFVFSAVGGMVENGVGVVKDVEFGDRVAVVSTKLLQCPICNVVDAVPSFIVAVEGKALSRIWQKNI